MGPFRTRACAGGSVVGGWTGASKGTALLVVTRVDACTPGVCSCILGIGAQPCYRLDLETGSSRHCLMDEEGEIPVSQNPRICFPLAAPT